MAEKQKLKLYIKNGKLYAETEEGVSEEIGNAIYLNKYVTNVDTDVITIKLAFEDNGKKIIKALPRDKITSNGMISLTKYGADTWKENADLYTEYIREKIKTVERSYEHSNLGWGVYEDKEYFRLYKGIGFNSIYDGVKFNIKPIGNYDEWKRCIKTEVLGNRWLELALAAGFTAPLIKILSDESEMDSLFINICGESSIGKTLATRLAVSSFGRPSQKENGLMQSWYGTDQGLLRFFTGNFGVPMTLDDASTQEANKDNTDFVYNLVNGIEKRALNNDGSKREQGEWMTTVFSSSEKSLFDSTDLRQGLRVRLIEIREPHITSSAENARNISSIIMKNYGHAGVKYVDHLMSMDKDEIIERWEGIREELLSKIPKDNLSDRVAGKLAIIRLAGEIANEAMDLGLDIEVITDSLIRIEKKSLQTRDVGERAYQYIMEYFSRNHHKFFKDKDTKKPYGEIIGKYFEKNGKTTEIRIPIETFETLMEKKKFDTDQVIKLWKEKGILHSDNGKNILSRVFTPGMEKISQYAIKITDVYNQSNNDDNKEAMKDVEDNKVVSKKWNKEEKHSQQSLQVEYEIEQEQKQLSKNKVSTKISISKGKPKRYKDFDELEYIESVG